LGVAGGANCELDVVGNTTELFAFTIVALTFVFEFTEGAGAIFEEILFDTEAERAALAISVLD
jgi:hypothetical protein